MRTVFVVMLCLLTAGLAFAQSPLRPFELAATGGFADGPGYASRAPMASGSVSIGLSWLRVNGGVSYSQVHKQGTAGGYQSSTFYNVEAGVRNFFVLAGMNGNHTDQGDWTKDVDYRFGGAGFRWARYADGKRPKSINEIRALYYRELRSTYANHTQMYALGYSWDRQLSGALYLRIGIRLGAMYFDDNPYPNAPRRRGMSSTVGIGLVGRP